jgi:hypothetical protein
MRRILRAAAMAVILLAVLTSCDFLFMGVFPATVGQATARIDLSSYISAADAPFFHLSVVKSSQREYVILVSDTSFDSTLPHLLVLSSELSLQNRWTLDELVAYPTDGVSFQGTGTMLELEDGTIVIGNIVATPTTSGLSLASKASGASPYPDGWVIEGNPASYPAWSNFWTSGSYPETLFYYEYSTWTTAPTLRSTSVTTGSSSYEINGVFTDPEDSLSSTAVLAFSTHGSGSDNLTYFLQTTKTDIQNSFSARVIMEDSAYSGSLVTKTGLESESIHATSDGIVAFNDKTRSWMFFTLSDPTAEKSLHVGDRPEGELSAFSFSSGFFCTFDPATRILTRYEKWW